MLAQNCYNYEKSPALQPILERFMGRSVATTEGDLHKMQRRTVAPLFTESNVKRMDETTRDAAERLVVGLQSYVQEDSGAEKKHDSGNSAVKINALNWMWRPSLQIIGSVAFGHDFQMGLSPEAQAIAKAWAKIIKMDFTAAGFVTYLTHIP